MRILFASTHGARHFGPLIPFIDASVRGGHDVRVTGPPTLDPRGYPFRVGSSPPETVLRSLWDAMPQQPPAQGEVITVGTIFAGLNVEAMLPPTEQFVAEWVTDLVVREVNEYASAIAAHRAAVPPYASGSARRSRRRAAWPSRLPPSRTSSPGSSPRSPTRRTSPASPRASIRRRSACSATATRPRTSHPSRSRTGGRATIGPSST